ncbi:MAG: CoA ester lyase [Gammaproteobacteria bacterium]|nr:CoA ester lyase [Gammaproteobacteria bacterium]
MQARSYLFVPGDRPERFDKALNAGADAIILDLEDAVSDSVKDTARDVVLGWISPKHPAYIRVNGSDSPWHADDICAFAKHPGVRGLVLPMAEDRTAIETISSQLAEGADLIPIAETARAIWKIDDIAQTKGVTRIAFGSIDFQGDTGSTASENEEELLYARSRIVIASKIAGIQAPVDGVTVALDDSHRLEADTQRAKRFGFTAKLCIHPKQIQTVNQLFSPSKEDIGWAHGVLAAVDAASDSGSIRWQGQMVDKPVIERARQIIRLSTLDQ